MTAPALMSNRNLFPSINSDPLFLLSSSNPLSLMGDESCSEVSSSSPNAASSSPQSPPPLVSLGDGLSPTFTPSEITDVDLSFWELAINTSPTQTFGAGPSSTSSGISFSKSYSIFSDEGISPLGREDLSPASSISSFIGDPNDKKKKGGGSRQSEELCLVCGDRASGFHYNALTCEGCKGFFRRSITKRAVYSCKYGQNCEMDMYMRRKCQECRFKKCIAVGMRPECVTQSPDCTPSAGVVPEHTCQVKREQKKAREKDKVKDFQPQPSQELQTHQLVTSLPSPLNSSFSIKSCSRITFTKEHRELINRLTNNQEKYEAPTEDSLKKVFNATTNVINEENNQTRFHQITEMTRLTVELIVQFAQNLPGFDTIPVEDQITLLKACSSELITLRASRRYHTDTDSIVFADNSPCTRDFYLSAGMDTATTDSLFNFCRRMAAMQVDNAEYASLAGITLFSERPALIDPTRVEKIQFLYVETLYAYVTNKWNPNPGTRVAKLLDVLTQLRSLGIMNNEQCENFIINDKPLPELLAEIWDINKR